MCVCVEGGCYFTVVRVYDCESEWAWGKRPDPAGIAKKVQLLPMPLSEQLRCLGMSRTIRGKSLYTP